MAGLEASIRKKLSHACNLGNPPGPSALLFLVQVLSDSLQEGALPPSFNQACITLLVKKDKDPMDCASYRPISLLNMDVKILVKVLARRLEDALPTVIYPDQTGFY